MCYVGNGLPTHCPGMAKSLVAPLLWWPGPHAQVDGQLYHAAVLLWPGPHAQVNGQLHRGSVPVIFLRPGGATRWASASRCRRLCCESSSHLALDEVVAPVEASWRRSICRSASSRLFHGSNLSFYLRLFA